MASIRKGTDAEAAAKGNIAFEAFADEVFRQYARNCKPSTIRINRGYYRNRQNLPWFEGFEGCPATPVLTRRSNRLPPRALPAHVSTAGRGAVRRYRIADPGSGHAEGLACHRLS